MTTPDELALKILTDPAVIPDPHPVYKELRETAPLFKTAVGDMWVVSGFENCRALLRDNRLGSPDLEQVSSRIALQLPRVGFFSTLSFLANAETNQDNQFRVTTNQALIAALGRDFDVLAEKR